MNHIYLKKQLKMLLENKWINKLELKEHIGAIVSIVVRHLEHVL